MGTVISTIVIVVVVYAIRSYLEGRETEKEYDRLVEQHDNQPMKEDVDDAKDNPTCLDERTITGLVQATLRDMKCEYKMESNGARNYLYFSYQGENFTIECRDDSYYITIYDIWWYQISIYSDVEEIADLHKTINIANQFVNCTVIYTADKEIEQIGVHSKRNILFIKEIPEKDQYLMGVLNDFFKVQRFVMTELEKCKVAERI